MDNRMFIRKAEADRIRWTPGERLDRLFEAQCDALRAAGRSRHPAVVEQGRAYSYDDIDRRANQLARHLIASGINGGDRVGVLLTRTKESYIALLAIMKANAAYVPLDAAFPDERIGFILEDAAASAIVTLERHSGRLADLSQAKIFIDRDQEVIAGLPDGRLTAGERGRADDELSYIIYTSGTTGKPKGVAIDHGSICNFVRVAAETYGICADDRVYQGMTIAFDFSVEEIWVPLMAGATLVPASGCGNLVGEDLAAFLEEQRVSVLCCVPTLLATIERDLPELRVLLVSGEACPQNLVSRWHRPGRTMLNAYGPTEATVTATLTELYPDKPVTIGFPLPSYTVVILDPDNDELTAPGETGEIGIAGICLARGYVNRDDLTAQKFIPDFIGLAGNPSRRIYRTGDLGRINGDGEIEYLGRKDTQVKIRGYRIELTEIESVIMKLPGIAQAVVNTFEAETGNAELVAYYSLKKGARGITDAEMLGALRDELPPYMLPAYIEQLPIIPMTSSHKADRKALPPPSGPRCAIGGKSHTEPRNETERLLAAELAGVLSLPRVSATDDFFTDLGAHSLLMARFCAAIRRNNALPDVSMREIYQCPTIERLAAHLENPGDSATIEATIGPRYIPSDLEYYGCAALQCATGIGLGLLGLAMLLAGFHWTYAAIGDGAVLYLRIVAYFALVTVLWTAVPIAAKWLLIGRWRSQVIPVWSLAYFRFWLVKLLVQAAPVRLIGGPAYDAYLRLLGARIGRHTTLDSEAPICTDLFSLGDNTLVRNGTLMPGYLVEGNLIYIGPIAIGSNAFVGSASVVEIDTTIGDGGQLGHASCLSRGQTIPEGKRYHGTPAQETETNYCRAAARSCSSLRRWTYAAVLYGIALFVLAPAAVMIVYRVFPVLYRLSGAALLDYSKPLTVLSDLAPRIMGTYVALLLFVALLGLLLHYAVPRLLNPFFTPGRSYVLYGVHYFLQGLLTRSSSSKVLNVLFGDSSCIVHYLKFVGYRLRNVVQSGANFGLDQVHDNPFLCTFGSGTMASDGLSLANVEMSSSSFKVDRIRIGEKSFLGNNIMVPAGACIGSNVLLATKVMVPLDGPLRMDVGLLGSPCFEIPRAAERDQAAGAIDPAVQRQLLRRKNRFNLRTMAGYLASHLLFGAVAWHLAFVAILYYPIVGAASLIAYSVFMAIFGIAYWVLVERMSLGFGRLQARVVFMYDDYFLFHERHWKFCANPLVQLYAGTPFKNLISYLLGVKIGRKVFDDGAFIYDKTLIEIGDYANLNRDCVLQAHSLEEGHFKSDHVKLGRGCSIGCAAFVHYGVEIGDNATLGANAFLMKGEMPPANSVWHGNPARAVAGGEDAPAPVVYDLIDLRQEPTAPKTGEEEAERADAERRKLRLSPDDLPLERFLALRREPLAPETCYPPPEPLGSVAGDDAAPAGRVVILRREPQYCSVGQRPPGWDGATGRYGRGAANGGQEYNVVALLRKPLRPGAPRPRA